MIKAFNITGERSRISLLLVISGLILTGVVSYFVNYTQQKKAYYQLKHAESQINILNHIYISILISERDARGYRIYQKKGLKDYFLRYKAETFKLLHTYNSSLSKKNTTEQLFFTRFKKGIINRFNNLDTLIHQPTVQTDPKTGLIVPVTMELSTEQAIHEVDAAYQQIISYWIDKSKNSYKTQIDKTHANDIIFILSAGLILMISFLWILSSGKFIQQQKILNAELLDRNERIEATKKQLENFAYIVSHDLKTPLRNIKGLLGIIQKKGDKMDNAQTQEYFNVVINAAEDMNEMIENLLEYSRTSSVQEEKEELDVKDIVKKTTDSFELELNSLNGKIQTILNTQKVTVYPVLFQRLLMNLISNAIKYRSQLPPVIQIRCDEDGDYIRFSIKDNGIGIPEHQFENIFTIFKSLNPNKDSNGIGLSVCKKIVELHGGKIWVESGEGTGSVFYFTIPKNSA